MGFENMKVYQAAVLLDAEVQRLVVSISNMGFGRDIDQLQRAVSSVIYNIAEAFGSEQPGRKINHLEIARGSSDETRAILKRMVARSAFPAESIAKSCALTSAIAKMLTSWIRSIQLRTVP